MKKFIAAILALTAMLGVGIGVDTVNWNGPQGGDTVNWNAPGIEATVNWNAPDPGTVNWN